MLKLTDKDFKVTIITILNEVKQNIFSVNETLRRQKKKSHQRKRKKNHMEILDLKIKVSEIKRISLVGFNSQMEITEEKIKRN